MLLGAYLIIHPWKFRAIPLALLSGQNVHTASAWLKSGCAGQEENTKQGEKAVTKPVQPQSNMAELPPENQAAGPAAAAVPSMGYSNTHLHLLSASS